ncbi:MAG: PQQ-binding-like beta-propeller repeat protein [Thermoanaerobaculia bacterium]
MSRAHRLIVAALFASLALPCSLWAGAPAGQYAMFGQTRSRNMVSPEKGLPTRWDVKTGENVLWSATLGSQAYGGPVVVGDRIFMGTNNEAPRNPKVIGDRGVMMAFDAHTGQFLWQGAHAKLSQGRVNDWPQQGICSAPYVEGDRVYYVSNRAELICADTEGFRDGENDGAVKNEESATETDEDVVWKLDMIGELDVFPHNLAVGSPLIVGDVLYTVTANGVDEGHVNIPSPLAPSFIAVDKNTGKLIWESNLPGNNILHGQWSNATYGVAGGREQVVFAGGDGWLYSLDPKTGKLIWKFDCNPKDAKYIIGGSGTRNYIVATPVFANNKVYIGVGQDPEHGEAPGHLWAVPADQEGDVTGKQIWHRGGEDFHRTLSTVAIGDGLMFAADLSGFLYCLNPDTGELYWKHDMFAAVWGSPVLVDGKVYLGDEDGDVVVFKASKQKQLLAEMNMGSSVVTSVTPRDGVLFIASRNRLWALKEGIKPHPMDAPAAPAAH